MSQNQDNSSTDQTKVVFSSPREQKNKLSGKHNLCTCVAFPNDLLSSGPCTLSDGKPLTTKDVLLNLEKPIHLNHLENPGKNHRFSCCCELTLEFYFVEQVSGKQPTSGSSMQIVAGQTAQPGCNLPSSSMQWRTNSDPQILNKEECLAYKPFNPNGETGGSLGNPLQLEESIKWKSFKEGESKLRNARRKIAALKKKADSSDLSSWECEKLSFYEKIVNDRQLSEFLESCRQEKEEKAALRVLHASLGDCNLEDEQNEDAASKRKRSEDLTIVNTTKKQRNLQATDGKLRLFVLNERGTEFRISQEEWVRTESEFQVCYANDDDAPVLECDGAGWSHGHKIIACTNMETAEWIRKTINSLPREDQLSRKVVHADELHLYEIPRGWVWVPLPLSTDELFLKLLRKQNPGLSTEGWKVISKTPVDKEKNGQRYILLLNREAISFLSERNFVLNYSVSKVVINLFRKVAEPNNDEVAPDQPSPQL